MAWISFPVGGGVREANRQGSSANCGFVYWTQGKYSEAEGLYKRALAIRERALGENHLAVALNLNDLALVYRDQGRYGEAEGLYKRALGRVLIKSRLETAT